MPDWRPTATQLLWLIRIALVAGILILIGYAYGITLWDGPKVLAVPIVIGFAVPVLNRLQRDRELAVEDQRAQDAALQAYFDKLDELLLDKELRTSERDTEVRTVARMHTLAVLRRIGPDRKRSVLGFLYDSELIWKEERHHGPDLIEEQPPSINLNRADLNNANLAGMLLARANLNGTHLREANLRGAQLSVRAGDDRTIQEALQRGVGPLSPSVMYPALPAYLAAADLRNADLSGARLAGVDFRWAKMDGVDLTDANLRDAKGITPTELERQAYSLEGAIMPNGQKYEDWLADKEGHGKDGQNSDPS